MVVCLYIHTMIATNKITGKDITSEYLKLMQGKITNAEFERLTGLSSLVG
jgi:hypothetical protein